MAKQKGAWVLSYKGDPIMGGNTRQACIDFMNADIKIERDILDYSIKKVDYVDRLALTTNPIRYILKQRGIK